jgi:hypothetical protein
LNLPTSRAENYNITLSPRQANKVSILFLINTLKIFFKKEITALPKNYFFADH